MQQLPTMLGPAVHTDPTLLRYASAITEQKKCWELLAEKLDRFQILRNNTQQHPTICNRVCKRTQHVTANIVGSCWPTMLRPFALGFIERFYSRGHHLCKFIGTKECVCIRKEFNSHRTGLGHQHGRRLLFWDTNFAAVTSCENTLYGNFVTQPEITIVAEPYL